MSIPVDLTNAAISKPSIMKPSVPPQEFNMLSNADRNPSEPPLTQQRSSSSGHTKRVVHDLPATSRPVIAQPADRTVNELRVNVSSPHPSKVQEKAPTQLDSKISQQRITR